MNALGKSSLKMLLRLAFFSFLVAFTISTPIDDGPLNKLRRGSTSPSDPCDEPSIPDQNPTLSDQDLQAAKWWQSVIFLGSASNEDREKFAAKLTNNHIAEEVRVLQNHTMDITELVIRINPENQKELYKDNVVSINVEYRALCIFGLRDDISEADKIQYASNLQKFVGIGNMDTLEVGDELLAVVAILSPAWMDKWNDPKWVKFFYPEVVSIYSGNPLTTTPGTLDQGPPEQYPPYDSNSYVRPDFTNVTITQRSGGPYPLSDLNMVSRPKDATQLDDIFYFKDYAGIDQTIHTMDDGLNFFHEEFTSYHSQRGKIGHLFQRSKFGLYFGTFPRPDINRKEKKPNHGTMCASRAVGLQLGIGKNANLKLVPGIFDHPTYTWTLASFQTIVDDMKKIKDEKAKTHEVSIPVAYFSYAFSYGKPNGMHHSYLVDIARKFFRAMVELDAFIAVSAGNFDPAKEDGTRPEVDLWPALFADEKEFEANMLVVGSANISGKLATYSKGGPLVKVLAPIDLGLSGSPEESLCADSRNTGEYILDKGTSLAAPMVAGMAAYYLSILPELRVPGGGRLVRKHILDTAYKRCQDADCLPVLYNGIS